MTNLRHYPPERQHGTLQLAMAVTLTPIPGLPMVTPRDDLAALLRLWKTVPPEAIASILTLAKAAAKPDQRDMGPHA